MHLQRMQHWQFTHIYWEYLQPRRNQQICEGTASQPYSHERSHQRIPIQSGRVRGFQSAVELTIGDKNQHSIILFILSHKYIHRS